MSVIREQRLLAAAAPRGKLEFLPPTVGVVLPPVASPARGLQQRLERESADARTVRGHSQVVAQRRERQRGVV